MLRGALAMYERTLQRYPLGVKTSMGVGLAASGDVTAQFIQHKADRGPFQIDQRRLAAFSAFGAYWTGPINHFWLRYLQQSFGAALAPKMILQHGLLNPLVYLPSFYAINAALTGLTAEEAATKMDSEYHGTLAKLWGFWLPTTFMIFRFVAERHQAVVMSAIALVWNTLLSMIANTNAYQKKQHASE
jgi:hypothetical protein